MMYEGGKAGNSNDSIVRALSGPADVYLEIADPEMEAILPDME